MRRVAEQRRELTGSNRSARIGANDLKAMEAVRPTRRGPLIPDTR
jgi:hypothetical protein